MKKFAVVSMLLILLIPNSTLVWAQADTGQEEAQYLSDVSLNALGIFGRALDLGYEMRLDKGHSVAFRIIGWKETKDDWDLGWGELNVAYHLYPGDKAIQGFYWGPKLGIAGTNGTYTAGPGNTGNGSGTFLVPELELGHQWIYKTNYANYVLDFGGGVGAYLGQAKATINGTDYTDSFSGINLDLRIAAGIAFTSTVDFRDK